MCDTHDNAYVFSKVYWWWQFLVLAIFTLPLGIAALIGFVLTRQPGALFMSAVLLLIAGVAFRDMFYLWPARAIIHDDGIVTVIARLRTYYLNAADFTRVKFGNGTILKHTRGVFIFIGADAETHRFIYALTDRNPQIEVRHGLFY